MSGGSYEYAYCKIDDWEQTMPDRSNPRRMAFKKLLKLVSEAMHDIEWVDSSDMSPGDENKAIDAVFDALKVTKDAYKVAAFDEVAKLIDVALRHDRKRGER